MRVAVLAALVFALAGCAPAVRETAKAPGEAVPKDFPDAHYRELLAAGKPVYRIDPGASLVVIEVRRAGKLAKLGHDHVVASHDVRGWIAPGEDRADLYVPLEALAVDEADLRKQSGFDTQPSEADIDGTRANMRDKVLEVDRFPYALVSVKGIEATTKGAPLDFSITLHGTTRGFSVPVSLAAEGPGLSVAGRVSFDQSEFGITPYSVLGGAVAVRDRVDLRFHVMARREGEDR